MHTTGQLATAFGKSELTITRWVDEFVDFLTPDAHPGPGKTRFFSDDDVEKLALVHELRLKKKTSSEIYAALKRGDRGTPPTGREITLITNNQTLQELAAVKNRVEELEEEIQFERKRADQAEGKVDILREMLREKEELIERLRGHD